jgi:ferritin-like metal-binding protein YciE
MMTKSLSQRLDKIECGTNSKVENVTTIIEEILSGKRKSKPDPMVEALIDAAEKVRAEMEKNNGKSKSFDDYVLVNEK